MQPAFQGYRLRPSSFGLSVVFHCAGTLALCFLPAYLDISTKTPIYDEIVKPHEHKIIYYYFPKPLPDVQPTKRIGTFPKPRGRELSRDTMIAMSAKPTSSKQFIWQPVPKIEIKQDVPAPNLVARMRTSFVAPPPQPPQPKKEIQPNIDAPRAPQLNTSPEAPKGDVKLALDATQSIPLPKPVKAFVPPPPSAHPAHLTIPVQTAEVALPDASIVGTAGARNPLPEGLGAPSFSKGAPPPPSDAPPGASAQAGNAKFDVASVGLNPAKGPIPNGSRGGQFSRAPNQGEPASGEVGGAGLSVPGLAIHEDRSRPSAPPELTHVVLYADKVGSVPVSTLSVPLRPASRTIPRNIDQRFRDRDVYAIVIPIENLPSYSGDWILWFAERDNIPGDRPGMRSPIPLRKTEPLDAPLPSSRTEVRVQIAGIIRRDGKIDHVSALTNLNPALAEAVIRDVNSWEFKPATRDGAAVPVDVVIEIPFSLPPAIAKHVSP